MINTKSCLKIGNQLNNPVGGYEYSRETEEEKRFFKPSYCNLVVFSLVIFVVTTQMSIQKVRCCWRCEEMGLLNCRLGDLVRYGEECLNSRGEISFCGGSLKVAYFVKWCGAKLVSQGGPLEKMGSFPLIVFVISHSIQSPKGIFASGQKANDH